jgi:hypothetical protein
MIDTVRVKSSVARDWTSVAHGREELVVVARRLCARNADCPLQCDTEHDLLTKLSLTSVGRHSHILVVSNLDNVQALNKLVIKGSLSS